MNWTLQTDEQKSEPILNVELLGQRLRQLNESMRGDPLIAVVNAPDGSTLAVGVGRECSVLSYTAPGGSPSKHVVNENGSDGLLSYSFLGHFTEMPARYTVPTAEAIDVAIEFFRTGRLSPRVMWEDD